MTSVVVVPEIDKSFMILQHPSQEAWLAQVYSKRMLFIMLMDDATSCDSLVTSGDDFFRFVTVSRESGGLGSGKPQTFENLGVM